MSWLFKLLGQWEKSQWVNKSIKFMHPTYEEQKSTVGSEQEWRFRKENDSKAFEMYTILYLWSSKMQSGK